MKLLGYFVGWCMIAVGCYFFLDYAVEGTRFHGDRNCYVGFGLWIVGTLWIMIGCLSSLAEQRTSRPPTTISSTTAGFRPALRKG